MDDEPITITLTWEQREWMRGIWETRFTYPADVISELIDEAIRQDKRETLKRDKEAAAGE